MITRRAFLAASASLLALPPVARANPGLSLRAAPTTVQILPPEDPPTELWGYNGRSPGPELRLKQGARLALRFDNGLSEDSAIHWHGIRIDNAMDGVPGLTQAAVAPGDSFTYDFVLPDAGTYWYHSHNRSWEQVARGLYGPLIVDEPEPPAVDHDLVVMLDDWRLFEDGRQAGDFENRHDWAHGGRLGNFARALLPEDVTVHSGERLRLRFINGATARIFDVSVSSLAGQVVALDGMPLRRPTSFDKVLLAPAQRMDVIADVTAASGEPILMEMATRQGPYELGRINVDGQAPASSHGEIAPLPPNRWPEPDLDKAIALPLVMQGGAMSRHRVTGGIWSLNGQAGMGEAPFHRFDRGDTAMIEMRNDTAWPHGIHLHGHHFQVLGKDGQLGPLRDTVLIDPRGRQTVVCQFDNPGKWLIHCHMLGHQAAGMKTWIEVTS